jgi:hypothetical protein
MMYARAYHFEVDVEQKREVPSRRLHLVIKKLGAFFTVADWVVPNGRGR